MTKDKNSVVAPLATLSGEYTPPTIYGKKGIFSSSFELLRQQENQRIYRLRLTASEAGVPPPMEIRWTFPAINVKGIWTSGSLYEKRLRADWEPADIESRVSVNAPVLTVFGHQDENRITFACSDVVYTTKLSAPVREEDNLLYCSVALFSEAVEPDTVFEIDLYIDASNRLFSECIQDVGLWWEAALAGEQAAITTAVSDPVYSTWYAYHQALDTTSLLKECQLASDLGYKTIIIDDGWQTEDNQRGYDYTGDWLPERLNEMRAFVADVHQLGMCCMLWYSVPFCGVKSKAYQRFKGKFLTENHRWAPVFDPRYPDVRAYLVDKYSKALSEWKLDGLKLDFIDDFHVYPETPTGKADGRDFANVNQAVDQLITEITAALKAINPLVLIEFRQKYIGPRLRKIGNMIRAFDCPNDSVTNRLRTTDVRLLTGSSKVHSDMFTWHPDEPTEIAALQLNSILFSVPQISVRLAEQSEEKLRMIRFFTDYYNANRSLLMDGHFQAYGPLENYSLLSVKEGNKAIYGRYSNVVVTVSSEVKVVDVINGRIGNDVLLNFTAPLGNCLVRQYDCCGVYTESTIEIGKGICVFEVPPSGLLTIRPQ